jgi:hypothetical protein
MSRFVVSRSASADIRHCTATQAAALELGSRLERWPIQLTLQCFLLTARVQVLDQFLKCYVKPVELLRPRLIL